MIAEPTGANVVNSKSGSCRLATKGRGRAAGDQAQILLLENLVLK